jgi:hypothetical protein
MAQMRQRPRTGEGSKLTSIRIATPKMEELNRFRSKFLNQEGQGQQPSLSSAIDFALVHFFGWCEQYPQAMNAAVKQWQEQMNAKRH